LREALRRLEARKLLTRIPHVGVRVVELSIAELLEMYQVREVLEGMAARLAAQNATDEEVTGLKALLTAINNKPNCNQAKAIIKKKVILTFIIVLSKPVVMKC
jgi:DNA-binding GntR family transcriptional regulator